MTLVITKIGNWVAAETKLAAIGGLVMSSAVYGQRNAAEKLVAIVRGHIDHQDLGWPAVLQDSGDPRILVDSELYRNSIKAWKSGTVYYAGVPTSVKYPKGNRVSDVAIMHEFGTNRMVERPLWGPSIKELGGSKGVRKIVAGAIASKIVKLRAAGFSVNKGGYGT